MYIGNVATEVQPAIKMSCCTKAKDTKADNNKTFNEVSEYYSKVLKNSKDLKTGACTAGGAPAPEILEIFKLIPDEIMTKFYGCGAPLPLGIQGLDVLDLGSGSGRDCYVCAALVGEKGTVTGIDMTEEQNEVARRHAEPFVQKMGFAKCNMRFLTGHIEFLGEAGIADDSVDLVISNCVVNLSPDKRSVIREAYRVLRPGGEMHFSDVYASRRVPKSVQEDKVIWGECIAGALYVNDFMAIAKDAGFKDPRVLQQGPVAIIDPQIQSVVGNISFYSITYRLFKLPGLLEANCEDYGQFAAYKGTIPGHKHSFQLDKDHSFETCRSVPVCGNTAAMIGENGVSWLSKHFEIIGHRATHFGAYGACQDAPQAPQTQNPQDCSAGSCC